MDPTPPVIGMWGTFDVDNYGDHLFPLVAAHELGRRLPGVELRFASPYGRLHPTRFDGAIRVDALPPWSPSTAGALLADHDCVLVGGGEIVHGNDRMLAPVYGASADELNALRPSGWFLEASTLTRSTPVVWHGVGVGDVRDPRVARGAGAADLVAVRDQPSRDRLLGAGVAAERVSVVPDTAFLIDRVFTSGDLAAAEGRLRRAGVLGERRRVVVQGCDLLQPHAAALANVLRTVTSERDNLEVVVVETGLGRGDALFADALIAALGSDLAVRRLPRDATLVDLAATIRTAEAFAGSSLHGCVTAAVFGLPFVCLDLAGEEKLGGLATVAAGCGDVVSDAAHAHRSLRRAFGAGWGGGDIVRGLQRQVDAHFDRIAELAREASVRREPRAGVDRILPAPHPAAVRATGDVVGFVVVNRRAVPAPLACLDRLTRVTWPAAQRRIVLVDDGPRAAARDVIAERWPAVEVVAADSAGVGGACNRAIAHLGAVDHVALVDSAALVSEGFVEPLVGRLQDDPTLGAVGPTILFTDRFVIVELDRGVSVVAVEADGVDVTVRCRATPAPDDAADGRIVRLLVPTTVDLPDVKLLLDAGPRLHTTTVRCGIATTEIAVDGPTWVAVPPGSPFDVVHGRGIVFASDGSARHLGRGEIHRRADDVGAVEIAAWSSAAVMLRRAYLDDVGGFREDLFAGYEDVDLSLRGSRRGWRYESTSSSLAHLVHDACDDRSGRLDLHLRARNRLLVLTEHAPPALVASALGGHARRVGEAVLRDVVDVGRVRRMASTPRSVGELLVLGGYLERLPRSLRGRWRSRRLPPPRWDVSSC